MKTGKVISILSLMALAMVMSLLLGCAQSAPASAPQETKPAAAAKSEPAPAAKPAEKQQSAPSTKPAEKAEPAAAKPAAKAEPAAAPKTLQKVKFQIPVFSADYLPLYMGIDKGIAKAEGLDAEYIVLKGELAVPAMLNGEVDYVYVLNRTLQAAVKGEPVRVILGQIVKAGWHIILGPGITSGQQLKGKSVAISTKGGADHQATMAAMKSFGLDPDKDVTYVVIPNHVDIIASLKSGAIGAGALMPPNSNLAVKDGMKDAVFTGDLLEIPYGGLGTTVKKINENPNQVKAVLKTILKGMAYVRDHKDETSQYLMKEFKIEKDIADTIIADEIKIWSFTGKASDQGLQNQLDTWKSSAQFKDTTLAQVKGAVDFRLLDEVNKELGLSK